MREDDPENDWRISGSALLSPQALAIVKELWHWREKEAEAVDLPVFKVLHNELLLDLAAGARSIPGFRPWARRAGRNAVRPRGRSG